MVKIKSFLRKKANQSKYIILLLEDSGREFAKEMRGFLKHKNKQFEKEEMFSLSYS